MTLEHVYVARVGDRFEVRERNNDEPIQYAFSPSTADRMAEEWEGILKTKIRNAWAR